MREGFFFTGDLRGCNLFKQRNRAVGDIGQGDLKVIRVDQIVELLSVLNQLIGHLRTLVLAQALVAIRAPQILFDRVPTGPFSVSTFFLPVSFALVKSGVDVTKGLGSGLNTLVVHARGSVCLASRIEIALLVQLSEGLGLLEELTGLIAYVCGVVRNGGVDLCLLVRAHLDGLSRVGHGELSCADKCANHVLLAGGEVLSGLQGYGVINRGSGAQVFAFADNTELIFGKDFELIANGSVVRQLEVHNTGRHACGRDLAGVIGDGHGQGCVACARTSRGRGA